MLTIYNLSKRDFDFVAKNSRFSEQSKEIAFKVLVENEDMSKIAKEYGLTRQRVSAIREKFYASYLKLSMFPSEWVRVSVCAPKNMLKQFLADVELERKRYFSDKNK